VLVLAALLGCLAACALASGLAAAPQLDSSWQADRQAQLVLSHSPLPALQGHAGQILRAVRGANPADPSTAVDIRMLHRAMRWQPDTAGRVAQLAQQAAWAQALDSGTVQLLFKDGSTVELHAAPRTYAGLGLLFWSLVGLALLVYLLGVVLLLARPQVDSLLFLVMALCQTFNLLAVAVETLPGPGLNAAFCLSSLPARVALDLTTAAAALQAWALGLRRLPRAGLASAAAWAALPAWLLLAAVTPEPADSPSPIGPLWWWAQAACLAWSTAAWRVIRHSHRLQPRPHAQVMCRAAALSVMGFATATGVVALTANLTGTGAAVAEVVSVGWSVLGAALLLTVPLLGRSRQLLREFLLLAGISTAITASALLLAAAFALGTLPSLTMAISAAIALCAGARHRLVGNPLGDTLSSTERTFDRVYRAAREVQVAPARYPSVLADLLRDIFEPLEAEQVNRLLARTRAAARGAVLLVPLRRTEDDAAQAGALALRSASRGRRLFTVDDARLADRVVDQLRRAVAYDQAVEHGRAQERLRIAQDLHDDIGARLLTLMYQAHSREMEDYIRHTLQDLKTLTRGLAASEHRLSHAAAEWKADLTQRLQVAHASLRWSLDHDHDPLLSVVQWSALTRVLRELVSNALYHGHATQVEVSFTLRGRTLALQVSDDGAGTDPQDWAHGLGLGGVRKRVRTLGGQVAWRANTPSGIVCAVQVPDFLEPP
jgi:signal transduction histidine kinase